MLLRSYGYATTTYDPAYFARYFNFRVCICTHRLRIWHFQNLEGCLGSKHGSNARMASVELCNGCRVSCQARLELYLVRAWGLPCRHAPTLSSPSPSPSPSPRSTSLRYHTPKSSPDPNADKPDTISDKLWKEYQVLKHKKATAGGLSLR